MIMLEPCPKCWKMPKIKYQYGERWVKQNENNDHQCLIGGIIWMLAQGVRTRIIAINAKRQGLMANTIKNQQEKEINNRNRG